MTKKIKQLLLFSILSIITAVLIYFIAVFIFFKTLSLSETSEEILWHFFLKDDLKILRNDKRIHKLESALRKIPSEFLPKNYTKIKIILIKDDSYNAFAAPGGRIIVTSALVDKLDDVTSMFILAHEISHLIRKDHLYEFSRAKVKDFYYLLTRSYIFSETLSLSDQTKVINNELLADQLAYKIVEQVYGKKENIENFKSLLNK